MDSQEEEPQLFYPSLSSSQPFMQKFRLYETRSVSLLLVLNLIMFAVMDVVLFLLLYGNWRDVEGIHVTYVDGI